MRIILLLTMALPLCLSPPILADVVHRKDAGAVEGRVEEQGAVLVVRTARGDVPIPRDRVLFVERSVRADKATIDAQIRSALRRVGSDDVEERLEALHEISQFDGGDLFRPLVRSLYSSRAGLRHFAAFKLGELGSQEGLSALVRTSLEDRDEGVRDAAFAACMKIGHPVLFYPFAKSLLAKSSSIRIRAARYLGAIGDRRAVEFLVRRYAMAAGGGGRSSFMSFDEQAYVRDFDVEVAQAAAIADPIIGVLRSGTTLDAEVIGVTGTLTTVEKRVIGESLEDLTGERFGDDVGAWLRWWKDRPKEPKRKGE